MIVTEMLKIEETRDFAWFGYPENEKTAKIISKLINANQLPTRDENVSSILLNDTFCRPMSHRNVTDPEYLTPLEILQKSAIYVDIEHLTVINKTVILCGPEFAEMWKKRIKSESALILTDTPEISSIPGTYSRLIITPSATIKKRIPAVFTWWMQHPKRGHWSFVDYYVDASYVYGIYLRDNSDESILVGGVKNLLIQDGSQ